jgi:hypothetical protein
MDRNDRAHSIEECPTKQPSAFTSLAGRQCSFALPHTCVEKEGLVIREHSIPLFPKPSQLRLLPVKSKLAVLNPDA